MSIIKFIKKITGTDKELSELELKIKELETKLEESKNYSQMLKVEINNIKGQGVFYKNYSQVLKDQVKDQEVEINNIKGQKVFYMPFDLAPSGCKDEISSQVVRFMKMRGLIPELTYFCVSYCEMVDAFKIVCKKSTPEENGIKFNF